MKDLPEADTPGRRVEAEPPPDRMTSVVRSGCRPDQEKRKTTRVFPALFDLVQWRPMNKLEEMKRIRDEVTVLNGTLADLRRTNGTFPVLGEGSHDAEILFVGEAPGKNEATTGRPFCGAAGKILTELVGSIGIEREEVYITNIVKDRPPENRDPFPDEIALYGPFLERQIKIIQPRVIATLGRFSMDYVMRMFGLEFEIEPISRAHGKAYKTETPSGTSLYVVPLYHPAASIYNRTLRETLDEDVKVLLTCLI